MDIKPVSWPGLQRLRETLSFMNMNTREAEENSSGRKRVWLCVGLLAARCKSALKFRAEISSVSLRAPILSPFNLDKHPVEPILSSWSLLSRFPSSCVPPVLDSLCCSLWIIPLCSLSLCQFNHFSHFKMSIPQFYRSSCLSLPVSTPTATPHVTLLC